VKDAVGFANRILLCSFAQSISESSRNEEVEVIAKA